MVSAVQEGIYLYNHGLDPYEGSIFRQVSSRAIGRYTEARHDPSITSFLQQAPLLLLLFRSVPNALVPSLFALADVGTALALVGVAKIKNADRDDPDLQTWWIAAM